MLVRVLMALFLIVPAGVLACSTHGTNEGAEITVQYRGKADEEGNLLFVIGIEDEIVEPVESTTCVTAIGLGSTEVTLPGGVKALSARVDRVNRATGAETRVDFFRFAADPETGAGMAQGGGSAPGDPRPIIGGAGWFGFSSAVDPFVLETGQDEYIRMTFEVLVPAAAAPLLTQVQFASGEGMPDGTPIFTGDHPVQYYSGVETLTELRKFQINAGLNDAWFNQATNGQGFLITVFPEAAVIFLAWFTYDLERPGDEVEALLGEPGHRWLTAQGNYADDEAVLDLWLTSGGVFDSGTPAVSREKDGTMIIQFNGCNDGNISYDIASVDRQGEIPIQRIVPDNISLCEELDQAIADEVPPTAQ
jgi:hypothetical protein